jgi:hypothetical protein
MEATLRRSGLQRYKQRTACDRDENRLAVPRFYEWPADAAGKQGLEGILKWLNS